jgi:hypothetical protein
MLLRFNASRKDTKDRLNSGLFLFYPIPIRIRLCIRKPFDEMEAARHKTQVVIELMGFEVGGVGI